MSPLGGELDTPPARSRRALLGAAGNGLTLAASGLLLPELMLAESDAVDLPVRGEHQRANRRRHRRRHRHPRNHDSRVLAVLALSRSQEIPSHTRTPIRFDMVLALQGVSLIDNLIIVLQAHRPAGLYSANLFLTWSGSDHGQCETGVLVNDDNYVSSSGLLSPAPTPVSLTTELILIQNDSLQVVAQQSSTSPAHVSAGAMVLQRFGDD